MEMEYVEGAAETAERSADDVNEGGEDAEEKKVGVEEAHGGGEKVVVGDVVGDAKEVIDLEAVGEEDNAAATKQTGVDRPTKTTAGKAGGERSRKKFAARGHLGSSASGRQAPLDVVEQLRQENRRLTAENARLEKALGDERGRVTVSDHNAAKRLLDATSAVSTTITDNITNHMDESWKAMKSFAKKASTWLAEIDDLEGSMAVERAKAVTTVGNHVEAVVDDAKLGLEDYISKHLAAAQTNIAAAVTRTIAVPPPPPPPQPMPAFPDELMKSFKADVLKAVVEGTQQSFVASGLKLMTEVIGNVAAGRRGSSPSANNADPAQRREADKQGQKRAGGGDDAGSVKRSKGADGSHGIGAVGPGSSRTRGQSVVDQLKKNGAKVRLHSKGDGIGSADGGHADEVAAQDAGPTASPHGLVGGKGLSDEEIPTAQTAIDKGARTVKGPSSPPGGSAEPKTTTDAVGKGESKQKGKTDTGKGRASSQRKTQAMSAETGREKAKEKSVEKGKEKAEEKDEKEKEKEEKEKEKEKTKEKEEKEKEKEKEEKEKEKGWKGHGIRHDNSGDGLGWVGEIKVLGANRYIGKSGDKMELAYLHSIAYIVYDGYVSKVLIAELTGLEETELEKWRKVWEEPKILPTGMWTNDDAQVVDAVGEGKAAAMVVGASKKTAGIFKEVMQAVLEAEIDREQPLGEVAHNVAPALQSLALHRVYPGVDHEVEADVIARATVETLAFWGMCPVAGPKLEEIGIAVPCDARMEYDIEHRGRKGQRGKQGKDSTGKKGKKGRKGKDSTAA
ncbi:unnamed protein product [Closterium sp. Naga37s-1]|nr:unnamed protein product [Closterium sp. Naga37s-1]